jgi:hypothetical protein
MDDQEKDLTQNNDPIDGQIGLEDLYYEMSQKDNQPEKVSLEPLDGQVTFDDLAQSVSSADNKSFDNQSNEKLDKKVIEKTDSTGSRETKNDEDLIQNQDEDRASTAGKRRLHKGREVRNYVAS